MENDESLITNNLLSKKREYEQESKEEYKINTILDNSISNINISQSSNNNLSLLESNNCERKSNNLETKILKPEDYYKSAIRDPGKEGRKASNIYFLRTFNNFIKSCLIHNTYKMLGSENICILDLCCGKGGDVDKFFQNNARLYVGVDMARDSLKQAKDRIEKIKNEKNKKNNCKCYLYEEDLSSVYNSLEERIPKYIKFDIVSCQMALHYHFSSEESINAFMKNVVSRLNHNGYFICTIIDDNVIVKRIKETKQKTGELVFGNKFYSVKFFEDKFSSKKPFGNKYGFYLEDSIDKRGIDGNINYVEEYLIMFENFKRVCKENFDLHLVEKSNFIDYYSKLIKDDSSLKVFRKYIKGFNIEEYEKQWEIAHLYQIVIFRKGEKIEKPTEKSNNKYKKFHSGYRDAYSEIKHQIKNPDQIVLELKEFE